MSEPVQAPQISTDVKYETIARYNDYVEAQALVDQLFGQMAELEVDVVLVRPTPAAFFDFDVHAARHDVS